MRVNITFKETKKRGKEILKATVNLEAKGLSEPYTKITSQEIITRVSLELEKEYTLISGPKTITNRHGASVGEWIFAHKIPIVKSKPKGVPKRRTTRTKKIENNT